MKKLFASLAIITFIGTSAFSFNSIESEDPENSGKKSECASVTAEKAVMAVAAEKGPDCETKQDVVHTANAEKAAGCSSSGDAEKAAVAVNKTDNSAACGSKTATQTAVANKECSDKNDKKTKIAENK